MDCSLLQEDLCAYIDNELEADDRAHVEAHLSVCATCAEEAAALRAVKSLVARLRLQQEDAPESLQVLPPELPLVPEVRPVRTSWLRQPIQGRSALLAAAAVLVALGVSWRAYERSFIRQAQQRDVVWAHLRAVSSVFMPQAAESGSTPVAMRSIPQMRESDVYALQEGAAEIGTHAAAHTVYLVGHHAISQFRFRPGEFKAGDGTSYEVRGRTYRVSQMGEYTLARYEYGPAEIVLVSATSPEALLALAQNIPPDTPFGYPDTSY